MRGFKHRNVLTMLAITFKKNRPYVILPFMENGDLKTYLGKDDRVESNRLLFSIQLSLADLGGGACRAHATPYGTQFIHFHIHFHQKAPMSEVHAPLTGARPPYRKSWIRHWLFKFIFPFTCIHLSLIQSN